MKASNYELEQVECRFPSRPIGFGGGAGLFQLSDARWSLLFRDSRRGFSCGLLNCSLHVEAIDRHSCHVAISNGEGEGLICSLVVHAPAERVKCDLRKRLVSIERASEIVDAVDSGEWWRDSQVFDDLDWSRTLSIAGIAYRAGWWGNGKIGRSVFRQILDFGPRGVVLRGRRTRFVIPWDSISSMRVAGGDIWMYRGSPRHGRTRGATLIVRSRAGQDAFFFTPIFPPEALREVLKPITAHLDERTPVYAETGTPSRSRT